MIVFPSTLLRMKFFFYTTVIEKSKHKIYAQKFVFENRAVYETKWKNIVQPDRLRTTTWRMRIACWIPKSRNRHSEYVIPITFPLQQ